MSKEIVVRKNPLSTDSKVLVVKDDATIEEMYEEVLKANKLPREGYDKYFKVYIGGHKYIEGIGKPLNLYKVSQYYSP